MLRFRLPGWVSALLALACFTSILTSASRLNTSWLVPAGNISVDYKALAKPEMRICALTFDDGPDAKFTPAVATILERYRIKATFFVVGRQVDAHPAMLKSLLQAGHEIGNHTQSHADMTKLSAAQQAKQISQLQSTLDKLGAPTRWFRPPYGAFNSTTVRAASKAGLETVLWSVDPRDWAEPGASRITQRVLAGTIPGGVVLLHSTHGQTVEALPGIIEGLQKKGYSFLTMSEWQAAVSGGKLPVPPAADPLVESGGSAEVTPTALAPVASETDQGAPRLLPPFVPSGVQPEGDAEPDVVIESSTTAAGDGAMAATTDSSTAQTGTASSIEANAVAGEDDLQLVTHANVSGPEAAEQVWLDGQGKGWSSWSSDLTDFGGVAGFLGQLNPAQTVAASTSDADLLASHNAIAVYALSGDNGWGTPWQAPGSLEAAEIMPNEQAFAENRFRPAPNYYLLALGNFAAPETWDGLASFSTLARLEGMLTGGQLGLASVPANAPRPRSSLGTASPAADAVIDPGLQGSLRALSALQAGYGNIYIAARPSNIAGYAPGELGRGQRELLLLRRLTAGLNLDTAPENDLATEWALPDGVRMLRFFDPQREVLALYCPDGSCDALGLPAAAQQFRIATLSADNDLMFSPAQMSSVELGRDVLLLYRELSN